jgi:trehalose 6-phosphate phosphatase
MKRLLSRENEEVLAQVAAARVLLAFDFDGTLAPIVEWRESARMRDQTARLLAKVCDRYPCAVISGREKADVSGRLGRAAVKYVVGNHGLEPGGNLEKTAEENRRVGALLRRALEKRPGVEIEDKRYSLAVHYRGARRKREARAAIHEAISTLPMAVRVVPGKLVVNVVPGEAPNKGDALLRLRALERADTSLYVGDDVTDEDVFRLDQPGRLLTVRVGESRSSAAAYCLRDQREIDRLLTRLVSLREAPGAS